MTLRPGGLACAGARPGPSRFASPGIGAALAS
jgi:hypothetical protein